MFTHNLGYPRIGSHRELKKACESYWSSQISLDELLGVGRTLRRNHWRLQQEAGIDLIPCNDFSFYDHVLDLSLKVGAIPARYRPLLDQPDTSDLDLYFAMARGFQKDGLDLIAMEMTKWFDTNYHYPWAAIDLLIYKSMEINRASCFRTFWGLSPPLRWRGSDA